MKGAKIGKMLLGSLYIVGSVFNLTLTTNMLARDPALYSKWVNNPLAPCYKRFFAGVVIPNAMLLTVLVALYELVIGAMMGARGGMPGSACWAGCSSTSCWLPCGLSRPSSTWPWRRCTSRSCDKSTGQ